MVSFIEIDPGGSSFANKHKLQALKATSKTKQNKTKKKHGVGCVFFLVMFSEFTLEMRPLQVELLRHPGIFFLLMPKVASFFSWGDNKAADRSVVSNPSFLP
jgi:hypothetical protein